MTRIALTERVVFLTGASSGIGAATARALAGAGVRVILCARRNEALEALRASLPNPDTHLVIPLDVADAAAVRNAVAVALQRYGHIDALVCCAGVGLTGPVASFDTALFWQMMHTNVGGILHPIQALVPHFRVNGGHIVVVTSVVAQHALPYTGGYAASKAALERLCEALRIELRADNVAVTVVRPGTVETQFFAQRLGVAGEQRRGALRGMPPTRVADAIVGALRNRRRVVYPRWRDWAIGVFADMLPGLSDRLLADRFRWQTPPQADK